MCKTASNAAGERIAGSDCAQSVSANIHDRELDHLTVALTVDHLIFYRDVVPLNGAPVSEIVAAIREDANFLNPLVERGRIKVQRGRKMIVLARYSFGWCDSEMQADIDEITAHYDDDTTENVPFD